MSKSPPKLPLRCLRWFCDPDMVDDIEGDLLERYGRHYQYKKHPNWLVIKDVMLLFRPGIIRPVRVSDQPHLGLLFYFLRIGWRNIKLLNGFKLANVLGLSLALAGTLLIFQYIREEYQTDSFFSQKEKVYRMVRNVEDAKSSYRSPFLSAPYKELMVSSFDIPEDHLTRVYQDDELVTYKNHSFFETRFFYTDPSFFRILDFPFLHGNPADALRLPNAVVISQEMAQKYFGKDNPIGEVLEVDNKGLLEITGVLGPTRNKSHLEIDFIAPIMAMGYTSRLLSRKDAHAFSYYLLSDGHPLPEQLPDLEESNSINWQLLDEIYFDQNLEMDIARHGSLNLIRSLILIGIIILLMAGANFLNLELCAFLRKIKNLGVRKAIGSNTWLEIYKQFIETYLTICIAIILALVVSYLLNETILKQYALPFQLEVSLVFWLPFIALALTLPVVLYTATIISDAKASNALIKKFKRVKVNVLQEGVLTFQFAVVMILLVLSLLISRQFQFMQQRELGLNPEQIFYFNSNNKHSFRNAKKILAEVNALSGVEGVAMTTGGLPFSSGESSRVSMNGASAHKLFTTVYATPNFPLLMEMVLLEGRMFQSALQAVDNRTALLNETAARQLGWPQQALVGESVNVMDLINSDEEVSWEIIGIIKDFHAESLQNTIEPIILLRSDQEESFVLKLSTVNASQVIEKVASIWETYVPKYPFAYHFLDQQFARLHEEATHQRKILYVFLGLTIAIALMGTLGLSTFMLQIRRKEIALRTVLGAPMRDLLFMLSTRYARLLLIAAVASFPFSLYFSVSWLSEFSYRIEPTVGLFFGSIGAITLLVIGLVLLQIRRSLHINPANELSDE